MPRKPSKPKTTRRGKNEGSVYRRKDGKRVGQVTVGYHPDTGKPIRKYTYANTREEAAHWIALTLVSETSKAAPSLASELLLKDFLHRWLTTFKTYEVCSRTMELYYSCERLHIVPALGDMLDAKNRNGQRNAAPETFGENRQRYNAREIVADFFGVTEYEIRKAVKLAGLIPPLADILESDPRHLPLSCADMIADYDETSQEAFVEMCRIEGYRLNKVTLNHITQKCPPPAADKQAIYAAWREARAAADKNRSAPSKKITFDRRKFAPYLEQIGSEAELEEMFLEFLKEAAHKRATPTG